MVISISICVQRETPLQILLVRNSLQEPMVNVDRHNKSRALFGENRRFLPAVAYILYVQLVPCIHIYVDVHATNIKVKHPSDQNLETYG